MAMHSRDALALSAEVLEIAPPWHVTEVNKDRARKVLEIGIECEAGSVLRCPECDHTTATRHDHVERRFRDMDWREYQVYLCVRVPRIRYPTHGVRQTMQPFTSCPRVKTTKCMEEHVLTLLKSMSVAETARHVKLSAQQVGRIQSDAVTRGLSRCEAVMRTTIGVDETSFGKRHNYITVVNDLESHALYVAPGKDADTLAGYFKPFDDAAIANLRHVVADMG